MITPTSDFCIKGAVVLVGVQLSSRRVDSTMRAVLLLIVSLAAVAMARPEVDDTTIGKFYLILFMVLLIMEN